MRCWPLLLFVPLLSAPAAASGQAAVAVDGRVIERGTTRAIVSARVTLEGVGTVTADSAGRFRFTGVAVGRRALTVEALGYDPADVVFLLARDTSLIIELGVAPVALDAVVGRASVVTVRGQVRDSASGSVLMRSEVTLGERRTATDLLGRFRFGRVAAGDSVALSVGAFGYSPVNLSFVAERDTTLAFSLVVDPVMQRMIAAQVRRIEDRHRPMRTTLMQPMDRSELMRNQNTTVLELLERRYGSSLARVQCVLIDDVQRNPLPGASTGVRGFRDVFESMLPDQLERIEVMQSGRGYMLRLYTRDYIRRMTGGAVTLGTPLLAADGRYCR